MLSSVLTSSAVALAGLLVAAPPHVDALVTPPGSGSQLGHIAARHLPGVSPHHNALARRKRNVHKNRKRCQQRPASSTPSTPSPAPQQSDGNPGDYNNNYSTNNGDNNSGSSGDNTNSGSSSDNTNNNTNNNTNDSTNNSSSASSSSSGANPVATPVLNSPVNPGQGKLGLAWPNGGDDSHNSQYFTGKAGVYYTWSSYKVNNDNGMRFCPMLWGRDDANNQRIAPFVELVKPGYADCVLGMNEPNEPSQSNMSPDEAAGMWEQYIAPLASQGYKTFGSPAPTSNPNGVGWVNDFIKLLQDHNSVLPTHICIHWYDVGPDKFIAYVQDFWNRTGQRPMWITEFACQNFNNPDQQCSKDDVYNFYKTTTAWMDQTSYVEYYFPFGFMKNMQGVNTDNQLMNQDGTPTDLGYHFINGF